MRSISVTAVAVNSRAAIDCGLRPETRFPPATLTLGRAGTSTSTECPRPLFLPYHQPNDNGDESRVFERALS